jgi:hypothetical protein
MDERITSCIEAMDIGFNFLESKYEKFKNDMIKSGIIHPVEMQLYLDKCGDFSIFSYLIEAFYKWNDRAGIINEVNKNLLGGNQGYFDYAENTFTKHYNFIIQNFYGAYISYFHGEKQYPPINTLYHEPNLIKDDGLIEFIEYHFIDLFKTFEDMFIRCYPGHKVLLIKPQTQDTRLSQNQQLELASFDRENFATLYEELIENKFIDADFEAFINALRPNPKEGIGKIKWIDRARNKSVNKVTLDGLVYLISVHENYTVELANAFMLKFFTTKINENDHELTTKNINSSRSSAAKAKTTAKMKLLETIVKNCLK